MSDPSSASAADHPEYADRVGRAFPGGTYEVAPWRTWLVADTLLDDPWEETPHPVLAWMAGVAGMGMTWDELFAWFDARASDGPMFGEHRTTLHRPLVRGRTYEVTGRIVSVDRKVGRRAGVMDVVGYELDLHADGEHVARCYNSIVFPRRSR